MAMSMKSKSKSTGAKKKGGKLRRAARVAILAKVAGRIAGRKGGKKRRAARGRK